MPDAARISVQLGIHPLFGLLILPVEIGTATLWMFISGSPVSGIAPQRWADLFAQEHLIYPGTARALHSLDHVTVAGAPVPRFQMRRSQRAGRFRLDGELGLNFFQLFPEACFHMPAQPDDAVLLTLQLPGTPR